MGTGRAYNKDNRGTSHVQRLEILRCCSRWKGIGLKTEVGGSNPPGITRIKMS